MKKIYLWAVLLLLTGCAHVSKELPSLRGKTAEEIKSDFGRPTIVHAENNASLWTYSQDDCSSLIFFDDQQVVQHAELRCGCANKK